LIPLAVKDPLLLSTVLALAARHRANEGQTFHGMEAPVPWTDNAQHNALVFKHQAIHGLSQIVGDPESCRSDPTIASIFLLIFLDLVESGNDRWNAHLEGAKALLSLNKSLSQVHDPGQTVQEIRSFITKQIYLYVHSALNLSDSNTKQNRDTWWDLCTAEPIIKFSC